MSWSLPLQNTFAVASCNDDAGTLPYATRPIPRSLTPHWDELAVFKEVAPSDRLHISVLDRRLMGPHLLLGQVCSCYMPLQHCAAKSLCLLILTNEFFAEHHACLWPALSKSSGISLSTAQCTWTR